MTGANFEKRAGKMKSEDGVGRERKVFLRSGPIWGEKKGLFLVKWHWQLDRGRAERREEKKKEKKTENRTKKKRENRRKSEKK